MQLESEGIAPFIDQYPHEHPSRLSGTPGK